MRVAAAAYPLDPITSWAEWERKTARWVAEARADLLVFPEYGAMELAHLDGAAVAGDLEASLHAAARHEVRALEHWGALAARHRCHVLTPSGPAEGGRARPVNRTWLVGPDGPLGHQDKQVMTRFERETWGVVGGDPLRIFAVEGWTVGVLICYDAEFPALGAALDDRGCDLILAPSCTDAVAGWTRVHVGARARALELQCPVVHAPTVGACDWSPAVDENRGAAAIYGPPDTGFPETGIVAMGAMDAPGWVRATLDRDAVRRVRADGRVLNRRHRGEAERAARGTGLPNG